VVSQADGENVHLSVADNGPGMDPETRARCVEPFFTTRRRTRATGLGLALVHNAVMRAGGRMEIQSEPGLGSTFTLVLPKARGGFHGQAQNATPVATLTVRNERLAALITTLLDGYEVCRGPVAAPGTVLWIGDAAVSADELRRFVSERRVEVAPAVTPRAIVMSDTPLPPEPGIVQLRAAPSPGEIRDAIRRVPAGGVAP
jgi:hypothetical protein